MLDVVSEKRAYGEASAEVEATRAALCAWLEDLGVITPEEFSAIGSDRRHHSAEEARWLAASIASQIHLQGHIPTDADAREEQLGVSGDDLGQCVEHEHVRGQSYCEDEPCEAEGVSLALKEVCAFHSEDAGLLAAIREDLIELGRTLSTVERERIARLQKNVLILTESYRASAGQAYLEEVGWDVVELMLQEVDSDLRESGATVVRWGESVASHIPSKVVGLRSVGEMHRPRGRLMLAVWQHLREANIKWREIAQRVPGTTQRLPIEQLERRISERARNAEECRTFRRYSAPLRIPDK